LERDFSRWGLLVYLAANGPIAIIRKAVGRLDTIPETRSFPSGYFDRLLEAREDILGQQVLSAAQEPSYEAVAGLLPPLISYTFLGTASSSEKMIVMPDGRLGEFPLEAYPKDLEQVLFDPRERLAIPEQDFADMRTKQGLLGGYLPAIDYGFYNPLSGRGWEQMAFASGDEALRVHLCLRSSDGKRSHWQLPSDSPAADGAAFYQALLTLHRQWEAFFAGGMKMEAPEPRLQDAGRAGILRAMITGTGLHPRYGAGAYRASWHDTFPPTVLHLAWCLMEWGFLKEAAAWLGHYLLCFVKDDGTFDYYGPALSEYGQMLALSARCVTLTRDERWLQRHRTPLERIGNRLLLERAASCQRCAPETPHYGLLWGAAEADTCDDRNYYFSGDLWCWRGLLEMGHVLIKAGLLQTGERWLSEAHAYQRDILTALDRVFRRDTAPPFLPPVAGEGWPFTRMTEDIFASYTNYRYWLEMLSAGLLPREMADSIIDYRVSHGGEVLGTTRFLGHLDDWPYAHYAWGLLSAGRISHYLLGFYGHLAHHQTPGTFTAYEQVPIRGDGRRDYAADYCLPVQVVTPLMLRWMLVWEEWDREALWLARAVPERWFAEGFAICQAPTRWGPVSLHVTPEDNGLIAHIEFASPPEIEVFLRLPSARQIEVTGSHRWEWEQATKVLHLYEISEKVLVKAQ